MDSQYRLLTPRRKADGLDTEMLCRKGMTVQPDERLTQTEQDSNRTGKNCKHMDTRIDNEEERYGRLGTDITEGKDGKNHTRR